jgi:hypothetical protein
VTTTQTSSGLQAELTVQSPFVIDHPWLTHSAVPPQQSMAHFKPGDEHETTVLGTLPGAQGG